MDPRELVDLRLQEELRYKVSRRFRILSPLLGVALLRSVGQVEYAARVHLLRYQVVFSPLQLCMQIVLCMFYVSQLST